MWLFRCWPLTTHLLTHLAVVSNYFPACSYSLVESLRRSEMVARDRSRLNAECRVEILKISWKLIYLKFWSEPHCATLRWERKTPFASDNSTDLLNSETPGLHFRLISVSFLFPLSICCRRASPRNFIRRTLLPATLMCVIIIKSNNNSSKQKIIEIIVLKIHSEQQEKSKNRKSNKIWKAATMTNSNSWHHRIWPRVPRVHVSKDV